MTTSAKVSIASNVLALGALAMAWFTAPLPLFFSYPVHKLLHLVGVMMFFGNLVAGPLWLGVALFEKGRPHFAFAARTLADMDLYLTTPGVQLAVWNGLCLASVFGGVRAQPWLVEAVAMMVFTSLFSVTVVLSWQEKLVAAALENDWPKAKRAMTWWSVFGTFVGVPLALVMYLMVSKQALWLAPPA